MSDIISDLIKIDDISKDILSKAEKDKYHIEDIKKIICEATENYFKNLVANELKTLKKESDVLVEQDVKKIKSEYESFFESIKKDLAQNRNILIDRIFNDLLENNE